MPKDNELEKRSRKIIIKNKIGQIRPTFTNFFSDVKLNHKRIFFGWNKNFGTDSIIKQR